MDPVTARRKLSYFFNKINPDRLSAVNEILVSYDNDFEQLLKDLQERYPSVSVIGIINECPPDFVAAGEPSSTPKKTSSATKNLPVIPPPIDGSGSVSPRLQQQHQPRSAGAPTPPSHSNFICSSSRNSASFVNNPNREGSCSQTVQNQSPTGTASPKAFLGRGFASAIATTTSQGATAAPVVDEPKKLAHQFNYLPHPRLPSNESRSLQFSAQEQSGGVEDPDYYASDRSPPRRADTVVYHHRLPNGLEEDVIELPSEAAPSILFVPRSYFSERGNSGSNQGTNWKNATSRLRVKPSTAEHIMRGDAHDDDICDEHTAREQDRLRRLPELEAQRARVLAKAKQEALTFYSNHPEAARRGTCANDSSATFVNTMMRTPVRGVPNTNDDVDGATSPHPTRDLATEPRPASQQPHFLSPSLSSAWTAMMTMTMTTTNSMSPQRRANVGSSNAGDDDDGDDGNNKSNNNNLFVKSPAQTFRSIQPPQQQDSNADAIAVRLQTIVPQPSSVQDSQQHPHPQHSPYFVEGLQVPSSLMNVKGDNNANSRLNVDHGPPLNELTTVTTEYYQNRDESPTTSSISEADARNSGLRSDGGSGPRP